VETESLSCNPASGIPPPSIEMIAHMAERRDSKGHFTKGNAPWNKGVDNSQRGITFTCRFCGKPKSIEELEVAERFFPPLPCCRDCWELLE